MDRQKITDGLERTERQLVEIAARIRKQKVVLARLEAAGENTAHAAFLLEQSLGWQKLNEAHRARLKRELERTWQSDGIEELGCTGQRQRQKHVDDAVSDEHCAKGEPQKKHAIKPQPIVGHTVSSSGPRFAW